MSIIEEPHEEWSTAADFEFGDEADNLGVYQMLELIDDGFKFRGDMFEGGLTANELERLRLVKKPKEKDPKCKGPKVRSVNNPKDKENDVETTEGESSDAQDTSPILQKVASQISSTLNSSSRDICQEINSLEIRLEKSIDSKLEKFERKIEAVVVENLKTMQNAIIKAVIDSLVNQNPCGSPLEEPIFVESRKVPPPPVINNDNNTPSELAESLINEVLGDLNGLSEANQAPLSQQDTPLAVNSSPNKVTFNFSVNTFLVLPTI